MRLAYYAGASTAAAAACLVKAFHERPNFYSATVYLSQSNACLLIITNLLLVLACTFIYALQRLLYGPLRPIEIEQLSEKAWYAVLDTLLAMPSFREDVGGWLLAMFTLLLAGKVWGWIGEGKVDVLEQQPPANPTFFHARLGTSLLISLAFDAYMLDYCVEAVMADPKPGMMVIFAFEFAILTVSSSFTLSRYGLSLVQSSIEKQQMRKAIDDRKNEIRAERAAARQNETADGQPAPASPPNEEPVEVDENELDVPGWEEKRRYMFALEIFTDFIKLFLYIIFFTVSVTFNGLPMHIMRDVYMTFASFSKRLSDYLNYRKATKDMNTRYPDATTEEIRGDACIVCRESMVAWEQPNAQDQAPPAAQQPEAAPAPTRRRDEGLRAKKLPCGHILHLRCLKAWLERQQVCPTCRRPVVPSREPTSQGAQQQGAPGAPGAPNPAAPPEQGRQPPAVPGRARILNLGPLRIGLLNGPGDQIANLMRHMQNPQAQPPRAGQGAAAAANQAGPNHLGLREPYLSEEPQTAVTTSSSRQLIIAQIQQRLVQDAHNLAMEQQELNTLRAMDSELTRLRTLQQQLQQMVSMNINTSTTTQQHNTTLPAHMSLQPLPPFQQPYIPSTATAYHGNTTQHFSNGHEHLPRGMVLPEGWTVMPLQRADATAPTFPTSEVQTQASTSSTANGVSEQARTISSDPNSQQAAIGPTDESGSPYFVPADAVDVDAATSDQPFPTPALAANAASTDTNAAPAAATLPSSDTRNPWNSEGGWSFVDAPTTNGHTSDREAEVASEQTEMPDSGTRASLQDGEESYTGKGKGKARPVELEDAPDEGG